MVYRPLSALTAPSVVPVTATLTPATGNPCAESEMIPVIRPVWARAVVAMKRTNKSA